MIYKKINLLTKKECESICSHLEKYKNKFIIGNSNGEVKYAAYESDLTTDFPEIHNFLKNKVEEKNIQTLIYDEMVELESFNSLDDLDDISEKSLIVLMYPVKKVLMEKIDSVISRTQSILYTPW